MNINGMMGDFKMRNARVNKNAVAPFKRKRRFGADKDKDFYYAYIYEQTFSGSSILQEKLRQVERRVTKEHYDSIAKEDRIRIDLYDDPSDDWLKYVAGIQRIQVVLEDNSVGLFAISEAIEIAEDLSVVCQSLKFNIDNETDEELRAEDANSPDYEFFISDACQVDLKARIDLLNKKGQKMLENFRLND